MRRPSLGLVLAGVLGASLHADVAAARVVEVGQPPPLFALPDESGDTYRLEDALGRPVVLYFTHNQCPYCSQVIASLKRSHASFADEGLTIVTVNVWADPSDPARATKLVRRYKEHFGLPFRMLAGNVPRVLRDYEVNYVPVLVFIGRDGLVRHVVHHYILPEEFRAHVEEIVARD